MATGEETGNPLEGISMKEAAQKALQANKDHQYALKVYTERLEDELKTIDKMLDTADIEDEDEDEPELDAGGYVLIPNSTKATLPLSFNEFFFEDSPFREDAEKRTRYTNYTAFHPIKTKELEVLAEAVRTENHRKRALEAQQIGLPSFASRDDESQDYFEWNTEGIDWDRVAEKVSSVVSLPRTARDCAIRWLGDRHPRFIRDSWSQTELDRLESFVNNTPEGPIDWAEIANKLGNNRTPLDCMRHAIQRKQHIWTPETDDALLKAVNIYGLNNWVVVATHVSEDATPQQCQNRYLRTLDPNIQRGVWQPEEDAQLRLAVTAYGNSWVEIADLIPGRTNDQCRDRWLDKINPNVAKGKWTDEEDKQLLAAVANMGTTRWRIISEHLGTGRTDSHCRARYERLMQNTKKPPKASGSRGQTSQTPSIDTETETQEAEPSSAPARPRPRPRPRAWKTPAAGEPQATERPRPRSRPKPRLRAKKDDEETPEKDSSARGEPTAELGSSIVSKEKGKGRAIAAVPDKATAARKRKSRGANDTGEAASKKRQKSTCAEAVEAAGEPSNGGVVGTLGAVVEEVSGVRPPVPLSSTVPQGTDSVDVNKDAGGGKESTSIVTNITTTGKQRKRKVIPTEPTRRQPSRATSRKTSS